MFKQPIFGLNGLAAIALLCAACGYVQAQGAEAPTLTVIKDSAKKDLVSLAGLSASGQDGQLFVETLRRNLELSGWFKVAPQGASGAVTVSGAAAGTGNGVQSNCRVAWQGKSFAWARASLGKAEVRRQAQELADEMVRQIKGEKGIATSRITFVNRKGSNNAELYVCDADGQGMMQVTRDGVAIVGPRWAPNKKDILYTSFIKGYPTVQMHTVGGTRRTIASFKGLNTGGAVSPDGKRVALVLSFEGNPELYILDYATSRVSRMTNTPHGVEASPCWSPDGRSIVYVSDQSRSPQLYLLDVASRQSKRLTYKGSENVNPDWSETGKITYATRRGAGYQIAVMDARAGSDAASEVLANAPPNCEHPSWAPDSRHIVCSSGATLYMLDTLGDPAVRLINIAGNWISPDWSK
ncbi:MAG: DPP IV N-terminal domain-containing protein [Kiritimatiellaeota bacterium]|nr:DPP IV N-terminal domain-containing protein [Kiritimatiellota bacterium]